MTRLHGLDDDDARQPTCMCALQNKAAAELAKHWQGLAPHFAAMQSAIIEAKAEASSMCRPMSHEEQVRSMHIAVMSALFTAPPS